MPILDSQKTDIVFKAKLNKASTNSSVAGPRDFFSEPYSRNNIVLKNNIWKALPSTSAQAITDGLASLVIKKPLTLVAGTTNAFTSVSFVDIIPFTTGSTYSYVLYGSDSTTVIPFGSGSWVVETDSTQGVVQFLDTLPAAVSSGTMYISYYQYIGTKGIVGGLPNSITVGTSTCDYLLLQDALNAAANNSNIFVYTDINETLTSSLTNLTIIGGVSGINISGTFSFTSGQLNFEDVSLTNLVTTAQNLYINDSTIDGTSSIVMITGGNKTININNSTLNVTPNYLINVSGTSGTNYINILNSNVNINYLFNIDCPSSIILQLSDNHYYKLFDLNQGANNNGNLEVEFRKHFTVDRSVDLFIEYSKINKLITQTSTVGAGETGPYLVNVQYNGVIYSIFGDAIFGNELNISLTLDRATASFTSISTFCSFITNFMRFDIDYFKAVTFDYTLEVISKPFVFGSIKIFHTAGECYLYDDRKQINYIDNTIVFDSDIISNKINIMFKSSNPSVGIEPFTMKISNIKPMLEYSSIFEAGGH